MHRRDRWYVVFVGRQVGIYHSWPECHVHVHRFPGALFKSYDSYNEADYALRIHLRRLETKIVDAHVDDIVGEGNATLDNPEHVAMEDVVPPPILVQRCVNQRDIMWCIISVMMFILGVIITHVVYFFWG